MKYLLLAFFFFLSANLFAQETNLLKEQEEIELMKWITSHRKADDVLYPERFIFPKGFWKWLDDELTPEEVAFLRLQHDKAPETWDPKKVKNVDPDFKIKDNSKYYRYSTPLFLPDMQYAVIVKEYRTGNLGADVCMLLLKRTETGWEIDRKRFKRVYCLIS